MQVLVGDLPGLRSGWSSNQNGPVDRGPQIDELCGDPITSAPRRFDASEGPHNDTEGEGPQVVPFSRPGDALPTT